MFFVLIVLFWKIIFEHKSLDNNNKSGLILFLCQNVHVCGYLPLLRFIFTMKSVPPSDSVLLN